MTNMKFREYVNLIKDPDGFFPTLRLRRIIRRNTRKTAREEAIAAEVIRQANPRSNITGHYPWSTEEQFVFQQLWVRESPSAVEWRDIPTAGEKELFTVDESGLPIPNALKEPEVVEMDLYGKVRELLDG